MRVPPGEQTFDISTNGFVRKVTVRRQVSKCEESGTQRIQVFKW